MPETICAYCHRALRETMLGWFCTTCKSTVGVASAPAGGTNVS